MLGSHARGSDTAHPSVACVIAGEARTLEALLPNLRDHLLEPLRCDAFLNLGGVDAVRASNLTRRLQRALRPADVVLSDGDRDMRMQRGLFARWAALYAAVQRHEAALGVRYQWVIRSRPDLLYLCQVTPRFLGELRAAGSPSVLVWDFYAVLPRRTAALALTSLGAARSAVNPATGLPPRQPRIVRTAAPDAEGARNLCAAFVDVCLPAALYAAHEDWLQPKQPIGMMHLVNVPRFAFARRRLFPSRGARAPPSSSEHVLGYGADHLVTLLRPAWVEEYRRRETFERRPKCRLSMLTSGTAWFRQRLEGSTPPAGQTVVGYDSRQFRPT